MLHFVMSYMTQNKKHKQTLESAQYGLEISFNDLAGLLRAAPGRILREYWTGDEAIWLNLNMIQPSMPTQHTPAPPIYW